MISLARPDGMSYKSALLQHIVLLWELTSSVYCFKADDISWACIITWFSDLWQCSKQRISAICMRVSFRSDILHNTTASHVICLAGDILNLPNDFQYDTKEDTGWSLETTIPWLKLDWSSIFCYSLDALRSLFVSHNLSYDALVPRSWWLLPDMDDNMINQHPLLIITKSGTSTALKITNVWIVRQTLHLHPYRSQHSLWLTSWCFREALRFSSRAVNWLCKNSMF